MSLPIVAIVGRPNVGKSSLLNTLARERVSIVDPTAGVTRDRVSFVCEDEGVYFELVDTGGYGIEDSDDLTAHVEDQISHAVATATLVLFVTDVRAGLTPLDRKVAGMLRRANTLVQLVVNKCDSMDLDPQSAEFASLGFGSPVCVSAAHRRGRADLFACIRDHLGEITTTEPPAPVMHLAVVGKRNAGKSTFINALAGQDRVIVSEVPGTTRDAVDVKFEKDGHTFMAIDTAGVRKRSKVSDDIEFYSMARAARSIRRADVVLLMIDAAEPLGQVDKRLARFIADEYKPCILVINKWDLARGKAGAEDYREYLDKMLRSVDYAPMSFVTANTGRNVAGTVDLASNLFKQARTRVSTGQLNQIVTDALATRGPRGNKQGVKHPKIFYATQVGTAPPTIALFVNDPRLMDTGYRRFLLNRLRDRLPYPEIPIRLLMKPRRAAG
jgi:GTP-binding protein